MFWSTQPTPNHYFIIIFTHLVRLFLCCIIHTFQNQTKPWIMNWKWLNYETGQVDHWCLLSSSSCDHHFWWRQWGKNSKKQTKKKIRIRKNSRRPLYRRRCGKEIIKQTIFWPTRPRPNSWSLISRMVYVRTSIWKTKTSCNANAKQNRTDTMHENNDHLVAGADGPS